MKNLLRIALSLMLILFVSCTDSMEVTQNTSTKLEYFTKVAVSKTGRVDIKVEVTNYESRTPSHTICAGFIADEADGVYYKIYFDGTFYKMDIYDDTVSFTYYLSGNVEAHNLC